MRNAIQRVVEVHWTGTVLLLLLLVGCGPKGTDEEIIESHLRGMAVALEEKNARGFVDHLAEDFGAVTLNLDRNGARLLLRREMMVRDNIRARLTGMGVEMRGEGRAVAEFRALLTGGSGLIPDEGRWYRVTTGWRRDGGDWKMISAQWEPVIGN